MPSIDGAISKSQEPTDIDLGRAAERTDQPMLVEEKKMQKMLRKFVQDEAGLELSEYAVMAALIVAALITVIIALRGAIGNKFSRLATAITTETAPPAP